MKGNILDLIFSNCPDLISSISVHPHPHNFISTDHLIISFCICRHKSIRSNTNHSCSYFSDLSKLDTEGLNNHLLEFDYISVLRASDPDDAWSALKQIISNAIILFAPKVLLRTHQFPKWFTPHIRHSIKKVKSLRRRYTLHPTPHLLNCIDLLEQDLRSDISTAKQNFQSDLAMDLARGHPSGIYKYIRKLTKSSVFPTSMKDGPHSASNDDDITELFNKYFFSVFKPSNAKSTQLEDLSHIPLPTETMCSVDFSEEDVFTELQRLTPDKAMGIDGISPKTLKVCALGIYQPVYHLFRLCFNTNRLPTEWKTHCIIPIFKSGNKSSVRNYRPISLLCVISKVLERIIFNKISAFVFDQISTNQYGFFPSRSTTQQLLVYFSEISTSLQNNCHVDSIYIDISKAFDSVSHNLLLVKLYRFGIIGSLWIWFRTYPTDRIQRVRVNSSLSSPLPVLSGVPQGSILGPLLFLLFINDMETAVNHSRILTFADDTKLFRRINSSTDHDLLQDDINALFKWSQDNRLDFNLKKSSLLPFRKPPAISTVSSYTINGNELPTETLVKDLGVYLSADLKWSSHYNNITSSSLRTLYLIKRLFKCSNSIPAKRKLFLSLVRPKLLYGSQVWRPHLVKDTMQLERIQRLATKFILNDYQSSYKNRLSRLNLLPLSMMFEINDIMMLLRSLKSGLDMSNHISFYHSSSRLTSFGKLVPHNNVGGYNWFYYNRVVHLYNALPYIDLSLSIPSLKNQIYTYFINHFNSNFNPDLSCTYYLLCPCSSCSMYKNFNLSYFKS